MEFFIVDAFTDKFFGGNQAGVVLLKEKDAFPKADVMQKIAAELRYSETAFAKAAGNNAFTIRYFTPEGEVDLCGHATISTFTVLRDEKKIPAGNYVANTPAGGLSITVEQNSIWMEMTKGKLIKQLSPEESAEFYHAYGLSEHDRPDGFVPCIVSTGLSDVLLPVNSKEKLYRAVQNRGEVIRLSKKHDVIGVHMFCYAPSEGITAECRNFAPVCGIEEEAATGTSNGALTFLLYSAGLIRHGQENVFLQGTCMEKPSVIHSKVKTDGTVLIGGTAVIAAEGCLRIS